MKRLPGVTHLLSYSVQIAAVQRYYRTDFFSTIALPFVCDADNILNTSRLFFFHDMYLQRFDNVMKSETDSNYIQTK